MIWAMVFIFITIFPLIKPEKQVSGMPENTYIHFLTFISMEDSWRRVLGSEGHEFTHACVCTHTYLHTCACSDTIPNFFAFSLSAVVSFFNLGCHNTAECWCKEKCRFRWVLCLTTHNSAIVFMNFCLVFRILGNLVCNPTGYKLEVIFNLPEKIGDGWRCLWSDALSKNRPGLLTISNILGFFCLFLESKV